MSGMTKGATVRPTIATMLGQIPDMATEAWATRHHPWRPQVTTRHQRSVPGSRPPVSLHMLDVLAIDDEDAEKGGLFMLTQAVRVIWEDLTAAGEPTPDRAERATWASECAWMLACIDTWQAVCDEASYATVESLIRQVWQDLRTLTHAPQPIAFRCITPGCGGAIDAKLVPIPEAIGNADAEALTRWELARWCEHGHEVDREEASRQWERRQPATLGAIAERTGIPARTLRHWAQTGKLTPCGQRGKDTLYDPSEVERYDLARKAGLTA